MALSLKPYQCTPGILKFDSNTPQDCNSRPSSQYPHMHTGPDDGPNTRPREDVSVTPSPDFWNKLAEKYASQPIENEAAYEHKLAKTQELFTLETKVLEFACGTGSTALIHAPHVGHITGIDFSKDMIGIAKTKLAASDVTNVDFEVASIQDHTAPDASYDVIMGMSILHLLFDRAEVMAKVHRLLKPGGHFVSSTACLGDGTPIIPLVLPLMRLLGKAPPVAIFKGDALVGEIEQAGFEISYHWRPKPTSALFVIARKPA